MTARTALQLELCSLTAKSLTAVFLQSGSFFLQSGSRTCSLAPLFCSLAPLLQSGSLKKARLQQKRARLQKQRSQTASQKGRKGRKGAKNSQKQPDCSQIPSQTAKNRASQTAAKYRFCRARLQSRARLQPPCRHTGLLWLGCSLARRAEQGTSSIMQISSISNYSVFCLLLFQ